MHPPLAIRALVVSVVLLLQPRLVAAAFFDYAFDRAVISSALGAFVDDEFNDGSIAPWTPTGTVFQGGGAVHAASPGTIQGGVEISGVSIGGFSNGAGNRVFTVTIPHVVPLPGQGLFIVVTDGSTEAFLIAVGPDRISQQWLDLVTPASDDVQELPITAADIVGDIILRITFDDALNVMSSSFSLDGGATTHTPFAGHAFNVAAGGYGLFAEADLPFHEGPPGDPTCSDVSDNDGDGDVDASDRGCQPNPPDVCNGFDDDGDSVVDNGFPDSDGDGSADCVDHDQDNDGVSDGTDDCLSVFNPDQLDSDADGIGNACDFAPPPIVNAPSTEPIIIDGQFEPGVGEWWDVTPASYLNGASRVYVGLDQGQQAIFLMYDFSLSTEPVGVGEEVGPITFQVGAGSLFDVYIIQGGPDTNFGPHPTTSEGATGDHVRVELNGAPFDNSAGCVAGAVDFNTTSPNFPGHGHNLAELSVRLNGFGGGCYSPEPAYWMASIPGVQPIVSLSGAAALSVASQIFTVSEAFVNVDTNTGNTTIEPFGGDQGIGVPGRVAIVKPGKLAKFVSKPDAGEFPLPSIDPMAAGGSLRISDTGATAGDQAFTLQPGAWRPLGAAGAEGYKYVGTAADPCKVVLVKKKVIKAVCKGAGITLTPPFAGDARFAIHLSTTDNYCAQFGGAGTNTTTLLKRKNAAATDTCP